MMPRHRCYWKVLSPDMKISRIFGRVASNRYGPNITLRQSMHGSGDPYLTLLREGTTAVLNSYTSKQFVYQPEEVVQRLNLALMSGSTRQFYLTAYQFIQANSGKIVNTSCKFTSCG